MLRNLAERIKEGVQNRGYLPQVLFSGLRGQESPAESDILLREARYVVFDTELTGLSRRKDSVVSLGAVVVEDGMIPLGEYFYRVVSPRTALTGRSVVVHGITPGETSDCPTIEVLLPEFMKFCEHSILVGHFVGIDKHFLEMELRRFNGGRFRQPMIDTRKADAWMGKLRDNPCAYYESKTDDMRLAALAGRYGITGKNAHNALDDAFVTAQVWQRFLWELPLLGVERVRDILAIAGV